MASHWVVMSKAEILKIVKVIACVIGFGVLGTGIGILAGFGVFESDGSISSLINAVVTVLVFGILGTALGGYVGNRITRSKDK